MTVETTKKKYVYPFVSLVSQKDMKTALILNVIDPKIGGVMLMGDRGTGKSTAIRALADVLPEIPVIIDDPYNSSPTVSTLEKEIQMRPVPLVDLPLGATEDRVCGSIDTEKALGGKTVFEPGLLAKANRGILYVDEVNLLEDNLVNVLLDSAASGWNRVEREGISCEHPANFILVGSGNPEEGDLRPQLLDRFGMFVEIGSNFSATERIKVTNSRIEFDKNPQAYCEKVQPMQNILRSVILKAREDLPKFKLRQIQEVAIAEICSELELNGLRADLTIRRAACALASFRHAFSQLVPKLWSLDRDLDYEPVNTHDILGVALWCVRHRLPKEGLTEKEIIKKAQDIIQKTVGMVMREVGHPQADLYDCYYDFYFKFGELDKKGDRDTTMYEYFGHLPGIEFTYLEDAINDLPTYSNENYKPLCYLVESEN